ncbi:homeobox protein Hox-B4-like [Pectinophora gossypiella]|uniref:homeobox protein Hox-B4-like n=1 Tax=Pectinophora gossypiella TaxID=13191 RepID=UPI00214F3C0A|nr:homeobox protein Hox-B4-like [Pectinophora gossypiella]
MPIIYQEQLDKAFNGNVYMDYPVVSPPNLVAGPTMSMGQPTQGTTMGSYAYVPEGYDCRQMHLQMQYPTLFEETNETEWLQETAATLPDNETLQQIQWSELPPPELVPVTVSEPSPVYTAGPPVYNQQKFDFPSGIDPWNWGGKWFSTQQKMELEKEYFRSRYLDRNCRIDFAEILKLNEHTIKIWFQNRRLNMKKGKA